MQALSKKSWLALNFEPVPGTAQLTTPVFHPTKSVLKGTKKTEYMDDERGTRDANYNFVETTREGGCDPKGNWYNDTSPYFLIAAMGAITSSQPDATNAPTVYKHNIEMADTPPSLTLIKSYHSKIYYMAYSAVEKLTLKFSSDGKLLECDTSIKGLFPIEYTGASFTPTFSTVRPFAGYAPTITLNAAASKDISEFQLELSQKLDLWHAIDGNPDFDVIYYGERSVSLDYTARFDTDVIYQRFLQGLTDSININIKGDRIAQNGPTNYYQELDLTIPNVHYDSMEHDLGKENVLVKAKATALALPGDPVLSAYVQNTVQKYIN
ncbi:phage tail tube protein [Ktedonospora formicarum]|uniref:Uncharacterized protein n=1 Tax=Ktedonospora formicarum TaxID=2778364 RepID=A0A8J3MS58_9CHLR|nr:phage tail tube protein [Ktedonospora formicarum]GHO44516.1 hypothetical protein KSX_26790 [Ktedonospora formicarum]